MIIKYLQCLVMLLFLVFVYACNDYEKFKVTELPYVDKTSVSLYTGTEAGDRNKVQLTSSPDGVQYTWTSLDPKVATVDQKGLVTAVDEGFTTIVVASGSDKTMVDVRVRKFVPLTDFTLSVNAILGFWQDQVQVFATYQPANASEPNIKWTSSDPNIAAVYSNGLVRLENKGNATITASAAGITRTINVTTRWSIKMPKTKWSIPGYNPNSGSGTIGYSSQATNEGANNKITAIIDNNVNTYWHASYSNPNSNYPHWFIIDLGEEITATHVSMVRRQNDGRGQTGFQVFTCTSEGAVNLADPTAWDWKDQGEFAFNSSINNEQKYMLKDFPKVRYLKVYIGAKYRGQNNYAMISEFSVYVEPNL